jgi:hypothetical protein
VLGQDESRRERIGADVVDGTVAEGVALNLSSQKRSRGVKGVKNRYGVGISIDSEKHIISWHPV